MIVDSKFYGVQIKSQSMDIINVINFILILGWFFIVDSLFLRPVLDIDPQDRKHKEGLITLFSLIRRK